MKDSADIRKVNLAKIRKIMWRGGKFTKQQISAKTGLSPATCNTLLNEMEAAGEVIGQTAKLQEVGRRTTLYQINEQYESILCCSFDMINGDRFLRTAVLSMLGKVLESRTSQFDFLDYDMVSYSIREMAAHFQNVSWVIIGTPSIAEGGVIRHCDISELEGVPLVRQLSEQLGIPVYLENDMHLKAFGYYKKCAAEQEIVTIANFPSNVLPGTATIHAGHIIKGKNQFAGMVGFLPCGYSREEILSAFTPEKFLPIAVQAAASIIAVINPHKIIFTGDLLKPEHLPTIWEKCLESIPESYMPQFLFEEDLDSFYLEGMYQKILEMKGEIDYDRT